MQFALRHKVPIRPSLAVYLPPQPSPLVARYWYPTMSPRHTPNTIQYKDSDSTTFLLSLARHPPEATTILSSHRQLPPPQKTYYSASDKHSYKFQQKGIQPRVKVNQPHISLSVQVNSRYTGTKQKVSNGYLMLTCHIIPVLKKSIPPITSTAYLLTSPCCSVP